MTVLLLNASFEPLRVITLRRAFGLVLSAKAELLERDGNQVLRSAGGAEFEMPAVIRLRKFVSVPFQATAPLSRRTLLARDSHRCQVLGCTRSGQTVDHVIPRSRGGRHEWCNVALMCVRHNSQKSDRLLEELGWKLAQKPQVPRGRQVLLARAGLREPPAIWEPYLAA
ncbi:MAG: HNH endonuclease [Actinomycetes bacterium]